MLSFDTDFDHPAESVLLTHPETVMPFCVKEYVLCNDRNEQIYYQADNHSTRKAIHFDQPVLTTRLTIHVKAFNEFIPAALFEARCYGLTADAS